MSTRSDLAAASAGWTALADAAGTLPTQTPAWAAAAGALEQRATPILIGDPNTPAAAMLLMTARGLLEPAAVTITGEPTDLLARSPEALDALAGELASQPAALHVPRLPSNSPALGALRRAYRRRGLLRVGAAEPFPSIALGDAWQEVGGGLSSSRRSALRRGRRKAEQAGEVAVRHIVPAVDEVDELIDLVYAIEQRSWKGDDGTALSMSPTLGAFYRAYARELAALSQLRIDVLDVGGRPIAVQLGCEWRSSHWLFKIGYDAEFAHCSPGQLLLGESVADAARRGLRSYELLGTAASWTAVWTKDQTDCVRVLAFPATLAGGAALAARSARKARSAAETRARGGLEHARNTAARRYVAGPDLGDGLREVALYQSRGYPTVVGHWGADGDAPKRVTEECFEVARQLDSNTQLAIKLPAMRADTDTLSELAAICSDSGDGLHFDALGPETASEVLDMAVALAEDAPNRVGCTLTGRWARSVADASTLKDLPIRIRLVKSEWADPDDPSRDASSGFLEVATALAGRAGEVSVATHDAGLAHAALAVHQASGTPGELQVLHGMNGRSACSKARALAVPIRVYVPYGVGRIPYEVGWSTPSGMLRLVKDLTIRRDLQRLSVGA